MEWLKMMLTSSTVGCLWLLLLMALALDQVAAWHMTCHSIDQTQSWGYTLDGSQKQRHMHSAAAHILQLVHACLMCCNKTMGIADKHVGSLQLTRDCIAVRLQARMHA